MRRLLVAPVIGAMLVCASGCGNARTPVPTATAPVAPRTFHTVGYDGSAGVSLSVPENWTSTRSQAPLIGTVSSGPAMIALWRYQRTVPLPADHASLGAALKALVGAARARDPGLQVIHSAITKADGRPAVEVDVIERIAGQLRRDRSVHIYANGAEVVLEEYSPPALFHTVDHTVFSPVRRSLHLTPAA